MPVHDLQVKDDDLVVGTHGRSLWVLDDLTVIREWEAKHADAPATLYPIRPAVKWLGGNGDAVRVGRAGGKNPDYGAVAWFHLAKQPKEGVTIRVTDRDGKLVCEAKGKDDAKVNDKDDDDDDSPPKREFKLKAGLNRFVWDLTYDGADVIPGAKVDAGFPGMPIPVAPGDYMLELTVGKDTSKHPVVVRADPRVRPAPAADAKVSRADGEDARAASEIAATVAEEKKLSDQVALALTVRDDITTLSQTVLRLRAILKQANLRKDLLKGRDDTKDLLKKTEDYVKKLNELEEKLHNPKAKVVYDVFGPRGGAMLYSQLTWVLGNVADGDGPPTKAQKDVAAELAKRLAGYLSEFDKLTGDELKPLNEDAKKLGVPELYVPPVPKKGEKKEEKKAD